MSATVRSGRDARAWRICHAPRQCRLRIQVDKAETGTRTNAQSLCLLACESLLPCFHWRLGGVWPRRSSRLRQPGSDSGRLAAATALQAACPETRAREPWFREPALPCRATSSRYAPRARCEHRGGHARVPGGTLSASTMPSRRRRHHRGGVRLHMRPPEVAPPRHRVRQTTTGRRASVSGKINHGTTESDRHLRDAAVRRDMTEPKVLEDALRRSEEMYRVLFQKNPNPVWVCDAETLRILAVNEGAMRVYGYAREEFLGLTLADRHLSDDFPNLPE